MYTYVLNDVHCETKYNNELQKHATMDWIAQCSAAQQQHSMICEIIHQRKLTEIMNCDDVCSQTVVTVWNYQQTSIKDETDLQMYEAIQISSMTNSDQEMVFVRLQK